MQDTLFRDSVPTTTGLQGNNFGPEFAKDAPPAKVYIAKPELSNITK